MKRQTRRNFMALADDWMWPLASIAGDRVVKTPTFDKLASRGDRRILRAGIRYPFRERQKRLNFNFVTAGPISGNVEGERSRSYDHYAE